MNFYYCGYFYCDEKMGNFGTYICIREFYNGHFPNNWFNVAAAIDLISLHYRKTHIHSMYINWFIIIHDNLRPMCNCIKPKIHLPLPILNSKQWAVKQKCERNLKIPDAVSYGLIMLTIVMWYLNWKQIGIGISEKNYNRIRYCSFHFPECQQCRLIKM